MKKLNAAPIKAQAPAGEKPGHTTVSYAADTLHEALAELAERPSPMSHYKVYPATEQPHNIETVPTFEYRRSLTPPVKVGAGDASRATRSKAQAPTPEAASETQLANQLVNEAAEAGSDVNILCATYGLKREELGRLTGFSLRALAAWAKGDLPSLPAKRRLHEVRRLLDALAVLVKRERIPEWLHQSDPAFDKMTPLQVIEVGEIDRLWAMVHELGSGQPA